VEFVQEVFVLELIDLIENNDVWRAVVVAEAVEQDIVRGGLTVDVVGTIDVFK